MDHEKYYVQKSDGSYLIHFANRNGLSDDKLAEIFSSHGKVLSINNNGRPCGLCYVRYQTLTEVKRSIDGVLSSGIKILPHKQKMNGKNVSKPNIGRKSITTTKMVVSAKKNEIQVSNASTDLYESNTVQTLERNCTSIDNNGENDWYPYEPKVDVHSEKNTSTNTTALSMRHTSDDTLEDHIKVPNSSKDLPALNLMQPLSRSCASINSNGEKDCYSQERTINSLNSIKNARMSTTALVKDDPFADTLVNQSMVSDAYKDLSDHNAALPFRKRTSITKSTSSILDSENSKEDLKLDSNISNEHLEYKSPSNNILPNNVTHVFPMADVVVANIHPNLCIHNVLHILKKYNPLYISTIKRTPVKGIRYCHIYYTEVGDATATVNEFDMSDVFGNSLIVFMPQTLVEKGC